MARSMRTVSSIFIVSRIVRILQTKLRRILDSSRSVIFKKAESYLAHDMPDTVIFH
jgi:hypothetical protein